jgi:hypothetical protein
MKMSAANARVGAGTSRQRLTTRRRPTTADNANLDEPKRRQRASLRELQLGARHEFCVRIHIDDNGNEFEVIRATSECEATAVADRLGNSGRELGGPEHNLLEPAELPVPVQKDRDSASDNPECRQPGSVVQVVRGLDADHYKVDIRIRSSLASSVRTDDRQRSNVLA